MHKYSDDDFSSAVDRTLVHRSSTAEVLPTSIGRLPDGSFVAGLQWPRRHSFYVTEGLDSALVAETIRQLTVLTLHSAFKVPLERKFLMTGFGFRIHRLQSSLVRRAEAIELVARISLTDASWSGTDLRGGKLDIEIRTRHGQLLADGYGIARICTASTYDRIRRQGLAEMIGQTHRVDKVPASDVGRQHLADVMIGKTSEPAVHSVLADLDQPYFFDHALDHVPGVALIEAIRQHACIQYANPRTDFQQFQASFIRVVEYSPVATVRTVSDAENAFQITQGASACVRATATFRQFTSMEVQPEYLSSPLVAAQRAPRALLLERQDPRSSSFVPEDLASR